MCTDATQYWQMTVDINSMWCSQLQCLASSYSRPCKHCLQPSTGSGKLQNMCTSSKGACAVHTHASCRHWHTQTQCAERIIKQKSVSCLHAHASCRDWGSSTQRYNRCCAACAAANHLSVQNHSQGQNPCRCCSTPLCGMTHTVALARSPAHEMLEMGC